MTQLPITTQRRGFDLEERTLTFAKQVIQVCRTVPHDTVNRELVSQLIRASSSIGANYREANDALSKKDFGHRIRIVRREAKEAHVWLQLLAEAQPSVNGQVPKLLQEALELKKIFSAIVEKTT